MIVDHLEIARAIIGRHALKPGATLPILQEIQEQFGYLSDDHLRLVAAELNMTRAEIYGVATFYHDFRLSPPGAHRLSLCRAEACQAMGGAALGERARERLRVDWGETTEDGRVTLDQVFCLGLCACAPSAMIDGKLVGRLTPEHLDALLAELKP